MTNNFSELEVTRNGVSGLDWPVSLEEIRSVRDEFLRGVQNLLLPQILNASRQAELVSLLIPHFIGQLMVSYQAQALLRRDRLAWEQRGDNTHQGLHACFASGVVPRVHIAAELERGFPEVSVWRKGARSARDFFRTGRIRWGRPKTIRDEIVTVALGSLIEEHAELCGEKVRYVRIEEWFPKISANLFTNERIEAALLHEVMQLVDAAFAAGGEQIGDVAAQYLSEWLSVVSKVVSARVEHLSTYPQNVPSTLWRGTGGSFWARLLSHACQSNGGHVTGHDHALGIAMFRTAHDSVIEHICADRFMMWTEGQVKLGRKNAEHGYQLNVRPTELVHIIKTAKLPSDTATKTSFSNQAGGVGRRLLYVGTVFSSHHIPFNPMQPAAVLIDWEARMIVEMSRRGWSVTVKPHPETTIRLPTGYRQLGADVIEGRFEDVVGNFDVCLFSEGYSTPFYRAIEGKIPFAMADVGVHEWHKEALEALRARCPYVKCVQDSSGRLQVDWDEVSKGLEAAGTTVGDDRFARMFLG